ncbi:MAG: pyridoxamine 5'-phosphate oxidase family protein [Candidatus Sabulitectum sp.]|nr:pyridoxamine 5'-phosphate oxidase family protein [Candidatus Sabulitectum sp.]
MRLKEREIISRDKIDKFIMECSVVRLGMISRGEPYVVPLNFVYSNGTVYFHCALEGRKAEAMRAEPGVCLEFDEMYGVSTEKKTTYYKSVIAWGTAVFVSDIDMVKRVLEMICVEYLGSSSVITEEMAKRTGIIAIRIDSVTGKERKN